MHQPLAPEGEGTALLRNIHMHMPRAPTGTLSLSLLPLSRREEEKLLEDAREKKSRSEATPPPTHPAGAEPVYHTSPVNSAVSHATLTPHRKEREGKKPLELPQKDSLGSREQARLGAHKPHEALKLSDLPLPLA